MNKRNGLLRLASAALAAALCLTACRSPSPSRQMAPPTKKAQRQSFQRGEGGEAALTMGLYCCGVSFMGQTS